MYTLKLKKQQKKYPKLSLNKKNIPSLTFLVTAGPTREYIDPVRFLSNASSGKMGCELALAAKKLKHKVILVSGPTNIKPPKGVRSIPVISARQMLNEAKKNFTCSDIIIASAAVSDYRPQKAEKHKIKKDSGYLNIPLARNPDILKYLGSKKSGKVLVGFALESKNLLQSAKRKLKEKNLDLIVANSPESIGGNRSSAWIMDKNNNVTALKKISKKELAGRIINEALRIWKSNKAD